MKEQDRLENIEKIKKQGAVRADLYTGHRRLVNGTSGPKTVKSSITPERWALMKEQDRIEKIKKQGAVRADLYTGHRRLCAGWQNTGRCPYGEPGHTAFMCAKCAAAFQANGYRTI